jgi:hypothetical protein
VSSHCYWCTTAYQWQADSRGLWSAVLWITHQRPNRELRLNVSWCGEPLSSATRQISTLTEGRRKLPDTQGKDQLTIRGRMQNGGQVDVEMCSLLNSCAHFGHPDWGYTMIFLSCKVNARVKLKKSGHSPRTPLPPGTPASPKCPLRIHYVICHPGFNSQVAIQPNFRTTLRKFTCSQSRSL